MVKLADNFASNVKTPIVESESSTFKYNIKCTIPEEAAGPLIGAGGANIKAINKKYDIVANLDNFVSNGLRALFIRGDDLSKVDAAKEEISEFVSSLDI